VGGAGWVGGGGGPPPPPPVNDGPSHVNTKRLSGIQRNEREKLREESGQYKKKVVIFCIKRMSLTWENVSYMQIEIYEFCN
jgi:hypothetical protein